jgi:hypothetical protein
MKKPTLEQLEKITDVASMVISSVGIIIRAITLFKGKKPFIRVWTKQ